MYRFECYRKNKLIPEFSGETNSIVVISGNLRDLASAKHPPEKEPDEARLYIKDSPFALWIQITSRNFPTSGNRWHIVLIVNDYPVGTLNGIGDIQLFLKTFMGL